jgi:formate hydrogenlyase subunit 3/multisubunit Na+/H+ antiporter MnhD subunit
MSGVMLKVAVYGFIRVSFDLLSNDGSDIKWSWGVGLLVIGSFTALSGVLHAFMQQNLKRLLAWSSIENIGIIFMALGLALIFIGEGHKALGVLGLVAALLHCLNHAVFKSLMFLGAGAILNRTHEKNLDRMGGLIHRMPHAAILFLIGTLSIAALPPFNGFVSEWLTFQTALQGTQLQSGVLRSIIPIAAAMLALTAAIGAATFVKVYGVAFLGKARTRSVRTARDIGKGMRAGMWVLASLCLLLGILPTLLLPWINKIPQSLLGQGMPGLAQGNWLWLTPVSPHKASYAGLMVLTAILLAWGIIFALTHPRRRKQPVRRSIPWDCGFGTLTSRMQYTSTSFSMPIRRIFGPVWEVHETVDEKRNSALPFKVESIKHQLQVNDRAWKMLYEPAAKLVQNAARRVSRIQTGSIRSYLAYSFFTLLALLWVIT